MMCKDPRWTLYQIPFQGSSLLVLGNQLLIHIKLVGLFSLRASGLLNQLAFAERLTPRPTSPPKTVPWNNKYIVISQLCKWAIWAGLSWLVLWIQSGLSSPWVVSFPGLSWGPWDGLHDWASFHVIFQETSPRLVGVVVNRIPWAAEERDPQCRARFRSLLISYLLASYLSKQVPWPSPESVGGTSQWHGCRDAWPDCRSLLRQSTVLPYQVFLYFQIFE